MANQEQVALLKQGAVLWNAWRVRNLDVRPDLSQADLSKINLSGANLHGADLSGANLHGTDLSGADLSGANLSVVHLSAANLGGANFSTTHLGFTIFAWIDLSMVNGLDTVIHDGPSSVDLRTVRLPDGETRVRFLQGVGFSDAFLAGLPSVLPAVSQHESCFISYASQDEALARRLAQDLQGKGVRCWLALDGRRPGMPFHQGGEDALHIHECVLLILSEDAVQGNWISYEVETVLKQQALKQRDLLLPLQLDETVSHAKGDWAAKLRECRYVGDFSDWQDESSYQQHFAELLGHLKMKTT